MCTAITYKNGDFYFARNLDLKCDFGQKIVVVPRNYKYENNDHGNYAIMGMANTLENYPWFSEAVNEHGLCAALLYFPGNAKFYPKKDGKLNIAAYDLINYILRNYKSLDEFKQIIGDINITDETFKGMPVTDVHWIVADKNGSIIIESREDGLKFFDDGIGVLTNNPPYEFHRENLKYYISCNPHNPKNLISKNFDISPNGEGFGMLGIPGDYTPASRFVKAFYLRENSNCRADEKANVNQIFRILGNVSMVKGSTVTNDGMDDITIYTSAINADKLIYYYNSYDDITIRCLKMSDFDLSKEKMEIFDFVSDLNFKEIRNV